MHDDYTLVDISQFYDSSENISDNAEIVEGITLTPNERSLYEDLIKYVKDKDPKRAAAMEARIQTLNELAFDIATLPSLLTRSDLPGGEQTPDLLIDSLIKHQNTSDATIQLPSKATLGKGYIVSKIHTFSSFCKASVQFGTPSELTAALNKELNTMLFTLMAEDVYLDLISDLTQPIEFRRIWASSLLLLWDHRNAQTIESVAPVLNSVWEARNKLNPAFGTMMGTSELLTMSIQLDELWVNFVKVRMKDRDVINAMEEFLFGISYENIKRLRQILLERKITAISLDQASEFLGEHIRVSAGMGYRDFYSTFSARRDNARARTRLKIPGPHQTIEDYFFAFVTQSNHEKQSKDAIATSATFTNGQLL